MGWQQIGPCCGQHSLDRYLSLHADCWLLVGGVRYLVERGRLPAHSLSVFMQSKQNRLANVMLAANQKQRNFADFEWAVIHFEWWRTFAQNLEQRAVRTDCYRPVYRTRTDLNTKIGHIIKTWLRFCDRIIVLWLYKGELHDVYFAPNTVRVIGPIRITWAGCVRRNGYRRGAQKVLVWEPNGYRRGAQKVLVWEPNGYRRGAQKVLVWEPNGKRQLGRPRLREVGGIKTDRQ